MALRRTSTDHESKYSFGGDEFILIELDEAMSLETNLRVQQIASAVEALQHPGIIDVCPGHASYMVRFDPGVVDGSELWRELQAAEAGCLSQQIEPFVTRIVDVPVLFNDPWTYEVMMRFRNNVQDPTSTDIDYLARVNGLPDGDAFIAAITSTPHMITSTGCLPGVVWSYQMVEQDRQLEGPKYLRPRTETPDRAFSLGGALTAVYPVKAAGGYPMFGRTAAPVYDPAMRLPDFKESFSLARIGDLFRYRPIDRSEYDEIGRAVEKGVYEYTKKDVKFSPQDLFDHPEEYVDELVKELER